MKCLIVHLSDIHIKTADDPVFRRAERLVEAVRNLDAGIQLCVVAVTGDVTYSGVSHQYSAAETLLEGLKSALSEEVGDSIPVRIVLVPGNHDCDFTQDQTARKAVLRSVADGHTDPTAPSVIEMCTGIQNNFFVFRDRNAGEGLIQDSRLHYEYVFEIGDERVAFRCFNTAFMSEIGERVHAIRYPAELNSSIEGTVNVAVTMFHHTFAWFEPTNGRVFRKEVEKISDLILTGHEHDYSRRWQATERGENNEYIEGGALQPSDDAESEFNAILIDTARQQELVVHFRWRDRMYVRVPPVADWGPYHCNEAREHELFQLSKKTSKYLVDPGIELSHPMQQRIDLQDIWVCSDLREIHPDTTEVRPLVRGEDLFPRRQPWRHDYTIVTGPENSGKTTLAKRVYWRAHRAGLVPVLIDASTERFVIERLDTVIEQRFVEQYSADDLESYRQGHRSQKVFVVDNAERVRLDGGTVDDWLKKLMEKADRIVLFCNEMAHEVAELLDPAQPHESRSQFKRYRLQPFGHARRGDLVERWLRLDPKMDADERALARAIHARKQQLDTVIGKNFVPAYPVFILAVLQAGDIPTQMDLSVGTQGYFYELFIRSALARGATNQTFDMRIGYLSYLAYHVFSSGHDVIDEPQLRDIHGAFERERKTRLNFRHTVTYMLRCGILAETDAGFEFKYPYVFYYFVANYLRGHLHEPAVKDTVTALTETLHETEHANILLFLGHLSHDPWIIGRMIDVCSGMFAKHAEARLADDVAFLKKAIDLGKSLQDKNAKASRKAVFTKLDEQEDNDTPVDDADENGTLPKDGELLRKISVAFKSMQILGQMLKSFPGTLPGDLKVELASNCYGLGLRTLGAILGLVRENRIALVKAVARTMRDVHPLMTDDELQKRVRHNLVWLANTVAYGTIRRIVHAMGCRELEPVYEVLGDKKQSPARQLVYSDLQLNQYGDFPHGFVVNLADNLESKPLAASVLRHQVIYHFHVFYVDYRAKQSVCAKLGISYKQMQSVDPKNKLVDRCSENK